MGSMDEHILKAAKEIAVKFIECGRLSPTGFAETFQSIYKTVNDTVRARESAAPETNPEPPRKGK